ncbi:hypothetical protein CI238_00934 [Colletotrichum incanum]|uniref:Uncharacterized protein n=1 Tax=Colletotrichum incanum TaxID=1573173 RepID=A0A166TIF1_COLIC|nr:hypothetical protein CI238_00934 [Colletotrichum incanum]OHW94497.1 hypothetical protein CSPAE12_06867 [Colletotrichum incanum]
MEKTITAPSAANWRRPQCLHDQHTHQNKVPRKRKSSTSVTDLDMTNLATHWRRPVAGVDPLQIATDPVFGGDKRMPEELDGKPMATTRCAVVSAVPVPINGSERSSWKQDRTPFVLGVFFHECNDPNCKDHNGLFKNAEIRSIRNATRFRSQTRDDGVVEFGKHLKGFKVTPRKSSMVDVTMLCKHEKDGVFSGKGRIEKLREQSKRNESAVIHDPAIISIIDRDLNPTSEISTSGQAERYQELLRKLQRSSHDLKSSPMAKKPRETRPRQDSGGSGDSGVDVRSSVKTRSLNPMAKEFSAFAPKQKPVEVEKSEETSVNIPLSMLKKILGSSDLPNIIEAPQQNLEEIVANTIQRFGIPGTQQQYITPPTVFSPLVINPTLQPSLLQHINSPPISPTFGFQNNFMVPPFGMFPQMPAAPLNPSAAGFAPSGTHNAAGIPPRPPPFGSQFNRSGSVQSSSGCGPQMSNFMSTPEYSLQMANGPPMPGPRLGPHPNSSFFTAQASMSNQGQFFNGNTAPMFGPGMSPRPTRKPRVPDAFGQQSYEAYIEWRKANEPGYALECKARQARRALRSNGPNAHLTSSGPVTQSSQL